MAREEVPGAIAGVRATLRPSRSTPNRPSPGRARAAAAPHHASDTSNVEHRARLARQRPQRRLARPTRVAVSALTHRRPPRARALHELGEARRRARRSRGTVEARAGRRQQHGVAGLRERDRARDRRLERAAASRRAHAVPASARAICGASRPISSTARQRASTARRSGAKSWPLPSPPAISTTGRAEALERGQRRADVRALRVVDVQHAAARRRSAPSGAAGRGTRRARRAPARPIFATDDASASAASAFSALWRPTSGSSRRLHDQLAAAREPRAAAALDETPFLFRQRHARAERLHGAARAAASARTIGSSRFSICTVALREDARLRAARSRRCRRSGRGGSP